MIWPWIFRKLTNISLSGIVLDSFYLIFSSISRPHKYSYHVHKDVSNINACILVHDWIWWWSCTDAADRCRHDRKSCPDGSIILVNIYGSVIKIGSSTHYIIPTENGILKKWKTNISCWFDLWLVLKTSCQVNLTYYRSF